MADIQGLHCLKRLQLESFRDSDIDDAVPLVSKLFIACSSLDIVDLIGPTTDWYTYSRGFDKDGHQPTRTNATDADSLGKRLGDLWIDY